LSLGGLTIFTVRTYGEDSVERHPCFDAETSQVFCDCPDYEIVKESLANELEHWPTLLTEHYQCKHIKHVVGVLWRSGRISTLCLRRALWFESYYGSLPE
jgi:hypothetical protein